MSEPSPQRVARSPRSFRRFLLLVRSNWISASGGALITLGVLASLSALVLEATGVWSGPYLGILTTLALPALIVVGILLIPVGLLLYRRRLEHRVEQLADRPMYLARAVVMLTIINFASIGAVGYTGVAYMSSSQFCGVACHSVMEPEYVAWQDSPHAHVDCVECHVGPGAKAMVESKLNGVNQLLGVITGDYSRPIPTPVHQLRDARETCENCHWPEKYLGTKLLVRRRFREDETNSGFINVLLMRTGGTGPDGKPTGIHWHTNPQNTVEYVATDEKRTKIPWVRVTRPDGTVEVFSNGDTGDEQPEGELRRMDCNDCHNRGAHHFPFLVDALDEAMANGQISRRIPSIRKNAREILDRDWSRDGAADGIRAALVGIYGVDGELDPDMEPLLDEAADRLTRIWRRNVYPDRLMDWGAYASLNSHDGCFRCHNGEHESSAGKIITNQCDRCHVVLSEEEENPAILGTLGIGGGR